MRLVATLPQGWRLEARGLAGLRSEGVQNREGKGGGLLRTLEERVAIFRRARELPAGLGGTKRGG